MAEALKTNSTLTKLHLEVRNRRKNTITSIQLKSK